MTAQIAQFVAQKTGLSPAIAQAVVAAALPKLLELLQGQAPATAAPTAGGFLGGLLK